MALPVIRLLVVRRSLPQLDGASDGGGPRAVTQNLEYKPHVQLHVAAGT